MPDAISFHWNTGKVHLIAAGGIFAAGIGLILLFQGDAGAKALGLVWIAALLVLVIALLRRARSKEPVVIVDAHGIFDRRVSDQIIRWEDIRAIDTLESDNVTFAGIDLKPGADVLAHLRFLHRVMQGPNRILHFPMVSIGMHALDGSTSDLLAAVARFRPELVREV
jgi:hypothetical protein